MLAQAREVIECPSPLQVKTNARNLFSLFLKIEDSGPYGAHQVQS